MRFIEKLDNACRINKSLLCVGLDIDLAKIPPHLLNSDDPIFTFNKAIIDATNDLVCAYKPNIAFFERYGIYGLESLIRTIEYVPKNIPVILDAKRGDIGTSSMAYAKAVFEVYKADAVTVNPYMGQDSIEPFMEYQEKGIFVLALTSNVGSLDFQALKNQESEPLYISVVKKAVEWDQYKNLGLVVGATNAQHLKDIRKIAPDMPILIPGIGTQGGNLEASVKNGVNPDNLRAIINASRSIIYAGKDQGFAKDCRDAAQKLRDEINRHRKIL